MKSKVVVDFVPTTDITRIMREVFEREKYRDGNYESRNKSDRKRDRKNRWR